MSGLSGLASFGFFAGGAAKGYETAEEQRRKNEEHEWRKEEQGRDKVLRESVAKAQGLDVQAPISLPDDVEGPRTTQYQLGDQSSPTNNFTQAQIDDARSAATSRAYRTAGKVSEAESMDTGRVNRKSAGLKMKAQERENAQGELTDQVLSARRRLAAGEDPAKVFQDVHKMNRALPNGYGSALVQGPDGSQQAVVYNEETGQGEMHPLNADTVGKALDEIYKYSSAANFQHSEELGLKKRTVKIAEDTQRSTESHQRAQDEYARGMLGVHQDHEKTLRAHYGASQGGTWAPAGRDDEGNILYSNTKQPGLYAVGEDGKPFKFTGDVGKVKGLDAMNKDPTSSMPKALGATGLITMGSRIFRDGPKGLEEVTLPGDKLKRITDAFSGGGPGGQPTGPVAPAGPRELTPGQAFRGAVGNSYDVSGGLRGLMGNREYDPNEQAPY